jgi:hypothetical protein
VQATASSQATPERFQKASASHIIITSTSPKVFETSTKFGASHNIITNNSRAICLREYKN